MNSVSTSSQPLQPLPAAPVSLTTNTTVRKVSWCPPWWNVFFRFSLSPLLVGISAALTGKRWLSSPRRLPLFPCHCVTWQPTARRPPAQMPNKCSQPEKDRDVFIGLCNQPVRLEERKSGEKRRKPSSPHSSTPSWQKNCNCSVCLLTRIPKASSCLGLYILIMSEEKKKKGKEKKTGFYYYCYYSLLCLTECHQRTMTCYSGRWRHCWYGLRRFYSLQIITPIRCSGPTQV